MSESIPPFTFCTLSARITSPSPSNPRQDQRDIATQSLIYRPATLLSASCLAPPFQPFPFPAAGVSIFKTCLHYSGSDMTFHKKYTRRSQTYLLSACDILQRFFDRFQPRVGSSFSKQISPSSRSLPHPPHGKYIFLTLRFSRRFTKKSFFIRFTYSARSTGVFILFYFKVFLHLCNYSLEVHYLLYHNAIHYIITPRFSSVA